MASALTSDATIVTEAHPHGLDTKFFFRTHFMADEVYLYPHCDRAFAGRPFNAPGAFARGGSTKKERRRTLARVSNFCAASLAFAVAAILGGCGPVGADGIVARWLDADIAGKPPYEIDGISQYSLVSYRVVRTRDMIVTAELTFKTRNGGDRVETHNFKLDQHDHVELVR